MTLGKWRSGHFPSPSPIPRAGKLQSLTKCSYARRVTASLAFRSAAHAPRRFYATPVNRDIINLLDECASLGFYPSVAPTPFVLTFRLVVSSISVDRCGERGWFRRRNTYKIRSFRMVANLKVRVVMRARAYVIFLPSHRSRSR